MHINDPRVDMDFSRNSSIFYLTINIFHITLFVIKLLSFNKLSIKILGKVGSDSLIQKKYRKRNLTFTN